MIIDLLLAQDRLEKIAAAQTAEASEIHQPLTVPELQQIATTIAINHGITDVWRFLSVAQCESGWSAGVRSQAIRDGIQENSWGLFQLNLDAHTSISRAQAINPYFNIEWAAQHWNDAPHHWKICFASAVL